jgi:hypothetical protein
MEKTVLKALGSFLASVEGIFFPGFADFCPIKQSHAFLRCLKIATLVFRIASKLLCLNFTIIF